MKNNQDNFKLSYEFFEAKLIPIIKKLVAESSGGMLSIAVVKDGKGAKGVAFDFPNEEYRKMLYSNHGHVETEDYEAFVSPVASIKNIYDACERIHLEDIEPIAKEIIAGLHDSMKKVSEEFVHDIVSAFPKTKEELLLRVEARLLNWYANSDVLNSVCHRQWQDLVILYTFSTGNDETYVTSSYAEKLGVAEEELYVAAMDNMIKNHKVQLIPMDQYLALHAEDLEMEADASEIWQKNMPLLCNFEGEEFGFGAISFLLPGVVDRIKELVGDTFYVFPSSIYEVIIQPVGLSEHLLEDSFTEEYNQELDAHMRLTNQVYFYDGNQFEGIFRNTAPII